MNAPRFRSQRPNISEDAIRFLRRRLAAMLGTNRVDAKTIAENIAFGAAALGAGHIELVDDDGWWFVASEFNWLAASKAHEREIELFEKILPFPEQSPTGHRAEIYVTAFAVSAYFRIGTAVTWLRGEPPLAPLAHDGPPAHSLRQERSLPDRGVTPPWCDTVLAFTLRS